MRVLKFNFLAIVLLAFTIGLNAQETVEKTFHEEYKIDKSSLFEISNKFGDIEIENTTDNKITIDAVITVEAKSKEKASGIIEKISISIKQSGNTVSAKTEIDNINSSGKTSFSIDYKIKMPAYLNTNLTNKYGGVTINELAGKSNIAVKYGSLNVNKLSDGNKKPLTTIELGYCNKSKINELNWAKLIVKYSKIEIEKGKALVVSSKYSKLRLGNFSSIVGESAYDDYEVVSAENFVMEAKYTSIEIENIGKKVKIDNSYGNISIENVNADFETINIVSKYAQLNIGIDEKASYKLDASTSYASIKHPELQIIERIKESNHTSIKGVVGNNSATSTVQISSSYGNINLIP